MTLDPADHSGNITTLLYKQHGNFLGPTTDGTMGGPARGNENTLSPYESSRKGKNLVKAYILRQVRFLKKRMEWRA
jgi:hypothetical protein